MRSITVFQKDLKAVSHAMALKDLRYYLCGVLIESNGAETRLVATDGHRLHAVQHKTQDNCPVSELVSFIVPVDMVKACLKAKHPNRNQMPEITFNIEGAKITAELPDCTTITAFAVEGKFPDYCRVLNFPFESFTNEAACYNPEYLVDADQALRDYLELTKKQNHGLGIAQRGSGSGVLASGGFVAIIMPLRADPVKGFAFGLASPLQSPEPLKAVA
jgi:hypothetical protein